MEWRNNNKQELDLRNLLVTLLIPGLSIDTIAGYLPSIGDVLSDLLCVAVPLTPLAVVLRCKAHGVLLHIEHAEFYTRPDVISRTEEDVATYLRHLHLLHGADHIRRFLAPVTLNNIALDGCAIDRHDSVRCCLMRVEPAKSHRSGHPDNVLKKDKAGPPTSQMSSLCLGTHGFPLYGQRVRRSVS